MAEQIECSHSSGKGSLRYLLHLPLGYRQSGDGQWPLLVFLHGWGESGENLHLLKRHGVPKHVEASNGLPFVVLAPQAPAGVEWQELTDMLMDFIRALTQRYRVNPDRIYLTGLSTGGKGAWALAVQHPDVFAAVAPVAGDIPEVEGFMDKVSHLRGVPIWAVHGAQDDIYPVDRTESIVAKLRSVQGNVNFTLIPDAGHISWEEFYGDPAFYQWMLEQCRQRQ